MSITKRLSLLAKAEWNALRESGGEPEGVLEEADKTLEMSERRYERVEQEIQQLLARIQDAEERAAKYLMSGDEEEARSVLREVEPLKRVVEERLSHQKTEARQVAWLRSTLEEAKQSLQSRSSEDPQTMMREPSWHRPRVPEMYGGAAAPTSSVTKPSAAPSTASNQQGWVESSRPDSKLWYQQSVANPYLEDLEPHSPRPLYWRAAVEQEEQGLTSVVGEVARRGASIAGELVSDDFGERVGRTFNELGERFDEMSSKLEGQISSLDASVELDGTSSLSHPSPSSAEGKGWDALDRERRREQVEELKKQQNAASDDEDPMAKLLERMKED